MGVFAYSFIMMLVHSLWQAGLLYLPYLAINRFPLQPLTRRNILLVLAGSQLLLSAFTFFYYYNGMESTASFLPGVLTSVSLEEIPYAYTVCNWFLLLYCAVIIYRAAMHVSQWVGFRNKCDEHLLKPSATVRSFTGHTARAFGISRKVNIWFHSTISGPLTYGVLKPVILIPLALVNNLSPKELESLIIHELTHIRYHDYAFNFMVIFLETIFFFNPFVRAMVGGIRLEREKNCDLQVINFRYDPLQYAETLLKALKMRPAIAGMHLGAVHRKHHLLKRIKFFTSNQENTGCRKYLAVAYMAIILFFCINLFTLNGIRNSNLMEATALTPGFSTRIMFGDGIQGKPVNTAPVREDHSSFAKVEQKEYLPDSKTLQGVTVTATLPEEIPGLPVFHVNFEQPDIKEMVISDTDPVTGNTITTVFRVTTVNGEVHSEPVLIYVEGKLKTDSIQLKKDSIRAFNIEQ